MRPIAALVISAVTAVLLATPTAAQDVDQLCRITPVTFAFERNQVLRTTQQLSGAGCTTSFTGGFNTRYDSISVAKRAKHLTITPTSNGFGFTVRKRGAFTGQDSYTLKTCGRGAGGSGCVTITYDVTVR